MKRSLLAGAAAALALAIPGAAAAQSGYGYAPQNTACERQRSDDKLAGGVAGALVGGLIGGAIGNNIDSGDDYYRGRPMGLRTETGLVHSQFGSHASHEGQRYD